MNKALAFLFLILMKPPVVNAAEYREFYNGARALGMGGATIAVVNDETALIINPAALGKLRNTFLTVADPELELGGETQPMFEYDLLAATDIQDVLDMTRENPEEHFHVRAQVFPSFVMPNFGIGFLGKYVTDGEVDATVTDFDLFYQQDFAAIIGYNFRLFDGILKIGFNGRLINRSEISTTLPASSSGLEVKNLHAEGMGIGSDVGLILAAPVRFLPTLSAVLRDVGDTQFTLQKGVFDDTGELRPQKVKQDVDAAFALFPILDKGIRMTFTGEYRGILTAGDEEDSMKRVHGGLEFNFNDIFFLRAGMNQRYWTAGVEFATTTWQFQAASYGEEVGTADANKEDRRYVVKFAVRF